MKNTVQAFKTAICKKSQAGGDYPGLSKTGYLPRMDMCLVLINSKK